MRHHYRCCVFSLITALIAFSWSCAKPATVPTPSLEQETSQSYLSHDMTAMYLLNKACFREGQSEAIQVSR